MLALISVLSIKCISQLMGHYCQSIGSGALENVSCQSAITSLSCQWLVPQIASKGFAGCLDVLLTLWRKSIVCQQHSQRGACSLSKCTVNFASLLMSQRLLCCIWNRSILSVHCSYWSSCLSCPILGLQGVEWVGLMHQDCHEWYVCWPQVAIGRAPL